VPKALFDFASDFDPYPEDDEDEEGNEIKTEPPAGFTYISTADYPAIVLGVDVMTGDEDGLSLADPIAVAAVHQEFLDALAKLPEDMRLLVESMKRVPRLEMLYGPD
jgi:hypothetical protein